MKISLETLLSKLCLPYVFASQYFSMHFPKDILLQNYNSVIEFRNVNIDLVLIRIQISLPIQMICCKSFLPPSKMPSRNTHSMPLLHPKGAQDFVHQLFGRKLVVFGFVWCFFTIRWSYEFLAPLSPK